MSPYKGGDPEQETTMLKKLTTAKLLNAAIDVGEDNDIVFRGSLDPETMKVLKVDDTYQRELQPITSQKKIIDALEKGDRLPDVELGMRGESFQQSGTDVLLKDPTYIIDGQQRILTALHYMQQRPDLVVNLGAVVHVNTTREWEADRFHKLNNYRSKVAPSVLLKNIRERNNAILMLYGLTHTDKMFPLHDRICWAQHMRKGEILTAFTFAKIVGRLHGHLGPGKAVNIDQMSEGLENCMKIVGMQHMRTNIKTFFELIDAAWGIRGIQYRESAIYIKEQFLQTLATVLSNHQDFWKKEKNLFIEVDLARKIASFPINDPEVIRLSGSSGKARELLYDLLVGHINSGKRTKRLKAWPDKN